MKAYIVTTTPETPLPEAVNLMDLYQATLLPVVDEDKRIQGVLTEHDIADALEQNENLETLTVGELMTQPAYSIVETSLLSEAADMMRVRRLKRVPVTTEDGRVVGILSRMDLFQARLEDGR